MYFRRALKLDRHYLSAWTLMGHEYVEMKNTSAAIGQSPLFFLASFFSYGHVLLDGCAWPRTTLTAKMLFTDVA